MNGKDDVKKIQKALMKLYMHVKYKSKDDINNDNTTSMNDLQKMSARFDSPETIGDMTEICGSAPVFEMSEYSSQVRGYTSGRGSLVCMLKGYEPCHNADEIIE